MSKARLGAGNVDIELDGETFTLRPTLKAAQTISRLNGGIRPTLEKVGDLDLDVITNIIAVGLDKSPADIAEKVWLTGIPPLVGPVTDFVAIVANGGRRPSAGGEEKENPPQSE